MNDKPPLKEKNPKATLSDFFWYNCQKWLVKPL